MFSAESFSHVSLIGLAIAARRVAAGIMHGGVEIRAIEDPARWWAGSAHPERGYVLTCRGETVAEIVEYGGRRWASWCIQYDPEGAEAFESALTAEADAARAVALCVRNLEHDGCSIVGAGENVAGQAAGGEPVAWFEYVVDDDPGETWRVYFSGDAERRACMSWARARDFA